MKGVFMVCIIVTCVNADAYAKASNLLLPITTPMAKPPNDAFSHQILLESKELLTSWENLIIVNEFIKKFGDIGTSLPQCTIG
jgi:hypothetical protein